VVPLGVVVDGVERVEGVDLFASDLLGALTQGARKVTTSQPPPAAFAAAYQRAAAAGAREIVSVHLSGELSGTVRAAQLAAASSPIPVQVVDSRTVGMALGFAAVEAARLAATPPAEPPASTGRLRGARSWWQDRHRADPVAPTGAEVASCAGRTAESAHVWFLVDSLDHLRRGGRLSAPAAALGTVLGLRPILTLSDGRVALFERVRTRRAGRDRLVALAIADAAGRDRVRIAVHHLGQPGIAQALADDLGAALGDRLVEAVVSESSAVLAAHAGPGVLGIVVADA